jgi:hypothetical protein
MATQAQIQANQKNSLSSSGPLTPSGKQISRLNSCKHGLAGSGGVVAPADRAKVEARALALGEEFRPESEFERSLVEQLAVDSVRLDRCRETYLTLCEDQANRAALCWDEDRRAEAEELALRLARDPARTRRRLEQDRHGCEVLIERWEGLGRIIRQVGEWDDSQRSMALDMLGVPLELRSGTTAVDPPEGDLSEAKVFRLLLVEAELERLRRRKARAFDLLDENDRESAQAGIGAELSKPLKLIARYESAAWRRQQAALKILNGRPKPPEPVAINPAASPKAAPPASPPRPEVRDDPPFRPAGSKPMSAMLYNELFGLFEHFDLPPFSQVPTGPRPKRPKIVKR